MENVNDTLRKPVNQVMELLVAAKYAELEKLTHSIRLTANEMANAIADYGRKLILPPQDGYSLMNVIEFKDAYPKRWSIIMPLWTKEEGRSDLTLEMTAMEYDGSFSIELDDIHVL